MKIYTKYGDKGETTLVSGEKMIKDDIRVEAYGTVDELNAFIGVISTFTSDDDVKKTLLPIQKNLFSIGAMLSTRSPTEKTPKINLNDISKLEATIDEIEKELDPIKHFIIPGGSKTSALLHMARTVCRRAERRIVTLSKTEKVSEDIIIYLNRLSDLLFVMARMANRKKRIEDVLW
ncbi:MAG: cob(I)yrinic acid a,c-diamide adenosyltransferase [Candidatus Micrarchaeota archaeon]